MTIKTSETVSAEELATKHLRTASTDVDSHDVGGETASDNGVAQTTTLVRNSTQGSDGIANGQVFLLPPDHNIPDDPATADYPILAHHVGALVEDIKQSGQEEEVLIFVDEAGNETVIKGRHRVRACKKLGSPCRCRKTHILRRNGRALPREDYVDQEFRTSAMQKQMTPAQTVITAAKRSKNHYAPDAKARQLTGGKASLEEKGASHKKAAKQFGISKNAVRQGEAIIQCGDVEQAYVDGRVSMSVAAQIAKVFGESSDAKKRKAALEAAERKDMELLAWLLGAEPTDDLGFSPSGRKLLHQWGQSVKKLVSVQQWVEELASTENALARHLMDEMGFALEAMQDSLLHGKPHCRCKVCGWNMELRSDCIHCSSSGWMSKRDVDRFYASQREQYKPLVPVLDVVQMK
ncbi:ParB N-terminal domain-containing protein [Pirellulales bacterium]|nr:ParB N-terminal domain-containing protein [Pirellulales bacterium]